MGLTNPFTESFSWTYLDNNWLWRQQSGNSCLATFTYNALGQVTDLSTTKTSDSSLLSEFSVPSANGYDGAGNRLSVTSNLPNTTGYNGVTNFQYDSKDQLGQEQIKTRVDI